MSVVYSLYDALVSINVPTDKAKAVLDAMERDMFAQLTTRSEFNAEMKLIRQEFGSKFDLVSRDIQAINGRIDQQTQALTIRIAGMLVTTVVLVGALIGIFKALL